MSRTTTRAGEEAQIRACIDAVAQALRAKDVNALMAHYSPDTVTFDLRLQIRGLDEYRKNFEAWFASVQGPIDYVLHDLHIATCDEVAFSHSLSHVKFDRANGARSDYWVRVTSGFQKMKGRWLIAHEHVSMPIDMETMQAQPDLEARVP